MNKERLRLKLLEAWGKGYINIKEVKTEFDWGFETLELPNDEYLNTFLEISENEFYSRQFDAIAIAVSKEILNSPLMRELS